VIFVDSSFWIALRVPRDPHHRKAVALAPVHGDERWVTSNHVRGETWTWVNRRAGHASAVRFLSALERSPRLDVVHVPEDLEDDALRWLRRRRRDQYSYVDATSFALMRQLGIRNALTFDEDFTAAGFHVLRI